MRYLVFGTGAVGGFVGGRLALAGNPVTFLARPRVARVLGQGGLRLTGDGVSGWLERPRVFTSLAEALHASSPDALLLAVKAYDCQPAAQAIASAIDHPPPVVCLLNGIGNEATLAQTLGEDPVIAASLTTAVQMVEPGVLRVERQRGLGLAAGHSLIPRLYAEMAAAGLRPRLFSDPDRMKWSKLLTNIVANATSAILGWFPGAIFNHPDLYRLEIEALRESVRVMGRMGLTPQNLPGVPVRLFSRVIFLEPRISRPLLRRAVTSGRGDKLPSFHADIGRGRSEVQWLNGAVVRAAERLGLRAPANAVLTQTLTALVEGKTDPAELHGRPAALLARAQAAGVPGIQGYNPDGG
jgi:2-dehydropantoate 2-reductase